MTADDGSISAFSVPQYAYSPHNGANDSLSSLSNRFPSVVVQAFPW